MAAFGDKLSYVWITHQMVQLRKCYCFLPIHLIPTAAQGLVLELPEDAAASPLSYEKVIGSPILSQKINQICRWIPRHTPMLFMIAFTCCGLVWGPSRAETTFPSYEQAEGHCCNCQLTDGGNFVKNDPCPLKTTLSFLFPQLPSLVFCRIACLLPDEHTGHSQALFIPSHLYPERREVRTHTVWLTAW